MYHHETFNSEFSEIVSKLLSNLNSLRIANKNKKLWRNKLSDVAASHFLKSGVKPEQEEFRQL